MSFRGPAPAAGDFLLFFSALVPTLDVLLSRLSSEHPRVVDMNPLPYQSGHSPFGTESSMIMNPHTGGEYGVHALHKEPALFLNREELHVSIRFPMHVNCL